MSSLCRLSEDKANGIVPPRERLLDKKFITIKNVNKNKRGKM